jgi:hypothetical protein
LTGAIPTMAAESWGRWCSWDTRNMRSLEILSYDGCQRSFGSCRFMSQGG